MQEFKVEFGNNPGLRIHVDYNKEKNVLVEEYFKTDLLSLGENYPALPIEARKTILKEVGLGLNDIHAKALDTPRYNTIRARILVAHNSLLTYHPALDVKPNNVFLNWHVDKNDQFQLEKVALGDMDCALKLEGQKLLTKE